AGSIHPVGAWWTCLYDNPSCDGLRMMPGSPLTVYSFRERISMNENPDPRKRSAITLFGALVSITGIALFFFAGQWLLGPMVFGFGLTYIFIGFLFERRP